MSIKSDRRGFLSSAGVTVSMAGLGLPTGAFGAAPTGRRLPEFFTDLEHRTFRFFWERANPANGMMPDRWGGPVATAPVFSSIAAIGFALTAYPLGVERGWVSRTDARARTLTTLRFLGQLPMSTGEAGGAPTSGVAGHRGFFYHFLDMETGLRYRDTELSTVDTTLLHLGALFAAAWFDGDDAGEAEIRHLATELVDRAEWDWFQNADTKTGKAISMGWHPESGFIDRAWDGYNEGKMVYILALGSGRHAARDGSWDAWTAPYGRFWRGQGDTRHVAFAPLFGHQYSEMWIDFRGIYDAPMRAAGFDYFENARRETYANRAYCIANPMGWAGYGRNIWGLTACDGPGNFELEHGGRKAHYSGYSARGPLGEPDGYDDGTLAPTAALASLPFAPEICVPAALAMHRQYGARLYGEYGFRDSFNPSFRDTSARVDTGSVDARGGWVASDYLGIDQGPILGMLANYRSEAVWRVMRRSPHIQRGLRRAGFTGGWLKGLG